jgi:hypothetical protein
VNDREHPPAEEPNPASPQTAVWLATPVVVGQSGHHAGVTVDSAIGRWRIVFDMKGVGGWFHKIAFVRNMAEVEMESYAAVG